MVSSLHSPHQAEPGREASEVALMRGHGSKSPEPAIVDDYKKMPKSATKTGRKHD